MSANSQRSAEAKRIRLFVALELPASVRRALVEWCQTLSGLADLRLLDVQALHVTLCFLGWRPVDEVSQIAGACKRVATMPAAELSVGEALWLPPRRPRVLAVDLEDPDGRLTRAQAELSRHLEAGGWYTPERRPFLAHVTVARLRRGTKGKPRALGDPPRATLRGETVTLFRSHLASGGAWYEALHSVKLRSGR